MGAITPAFVIAFARPWAYLVAMVAAASMAGLLLWELGAPEQLPEWMGSLRVSPEAVTVATLALLFGLLVPLQIAALAQVRSAASTMSGLAGTVTGTQRVLLRAAPDPDALELYWLLGGRR